MLRGLYTAAAGMMTIQERTDTTSNNLANVDTVGFKADLLRFTSAPAIHTWRFDDPTNLDKEGNPKPEYIGLTNCGTADTEYWRDFDQGQVIFTDRPLDVAIVGEGFFRIATDDGQEMYSRDGQLRRNSEGFLVNNFNQRIQGQNGDINLGTTSDIYINRSGEVIVDGAAVDTIDLAYFSDPQNQLEKAGDNMWRSTTGPDSVGDSEFRGGFIERSNVDALRCITELIIELRHYQAAEKAVRTADDNLNLAANQIGKMPQ